MRGGRRSKASAQHRGSERQSPGHGECTQRTRSGGGRRFALANSFSAESRFRRVAFSESMFESMELRLPTANA